MHVPRILRKSNSNGRIAAAKKKFYDQLVREIRAFGSGMDSASERTLPAAEHILAAKDVESKGGPHGVYRYRDGLADQRLTLRDADGKVIGVVFMKPDSV